MTTVPSAYLTFQSWLIKVSGTQTPEILTETTPGCGTGDIDPQIWIEASMFGEWDQPSTWYAVGDTIYVEISAYDPDPDQTYTVTIWDVLDELEPGVSWEYYPNPGVIVPIELVSFAADVADGDVVLSWVVASEIDNLGFYIQRSTSSDGIYTRISELIPGRGTSDQMMEYSWRDVSPEGSVLYYRLEDVDFSGNTTSHGPVRVLLGGTSSWGELKAEFSN
jgi:hypothetical protein